MARFRYLLFALLLLASAFAAWTWLRPYHWSPDIAARSRVVETLVTRDRSYFWVEVHLKITPSQIHDMRQPVYLTLGSGKSLEPADTTLGSDEAGKTTDLWLKFWLEREDLQGPLDLHLNGGKLTVKSGSGVPEIDEGAYQNFTTHRW